MCWVCIDGRVTQMTAAQAKARGTKCFGSQQEAQQNCKPPEKLCWVCLNGQVTQLPEATAQGRGLKCYSSRGEAASNCGQKPTPGPRETIPPTPPRPR
jgi:hypothetical protein